MSRHNQDIPIRPRYGIVEAASDDAQSSKDNTQDATHKNGNSSAADKVASSYSEIPFLAQYPGPVPELEPENMPTMTAPTATASSLQRTSDEGDGDSSLEDEDDDDDDDDSPEDGDEEQSKHSSCDDSKTPKRPNSLQCESSFPYELENVSSTEEGAMRHFVAEHLEDELRGASPFSKRDQFGFVSHNSTPSTSMAGGLLTRHFLQTQLPQIDANVLSDIEIEAQYLAASIDNLTENLCNLLHSISSITADNVEVHKNAVNKLTDSMDTNIKCMYTIMAKTEEITKSMKPTEQLGQRIREIKRLVDMLDSSM